jgi:small ligand-binding sensory domain FIST
MAQAGIGRADGGMVFFTADHAAHGQELAATLARIIDTDCVTGSSGAGVLTGAGEIEGDHGVAVMVFATDRFFARPFIFEPLRGNEAALGETFGGFLAKAQDEKSLMLLFPDTYNGNAQNLLEAIAGRAGFHPIAGAGSSENGAAGATYQLCGDKLASNSLAGMYISGALETHIDITQGCQPITQPMTITKAENNLILEIDNQPALAVFAKLLKGPLTEDLRRALTVIFVGLPADRSDNSVAPGKYLVRNIIGLDPDAGIIAVADLVMVGQSMIFTMRDGQRARDDLQEMLQRQLDRLNGKKPAFGCYFNCCARGSSLYGIPGIDAAYIKQMLGEFPLIGMFGGYELAPLGRANHLFAYTGVLVLVTE